MHSWDHSYCKTMKSERLSDLKHSTFFEYTRIEHTTVSGAFELQKKLISRLQFSEITNSLVQLTSTIRNFVAP